MSAVPMTFDGSMPSQLNAPMMTDIEQARAVEEVKAALVIAKRFPRDETAAYARIIRACQRHSLAEVATFAFPKGDTIVSDASIRLLEVCAQNWGNLQFGVRELDRKDDYSVAQAYAWDLETNTHRAMTFVVPHYRSTKRKGKRVNILLEDPRDIYEMIANQGARRVRSCLTGIIPRDLIDAAKIKCEETLAKGAGEPIVDRIRKMVAAFADYGVTKEQIEKRLGHKAEATQERELVTLKQIYRALKDGMGRVEDYFEMELPQDQKQDAASDLEADLKKASENKTQASQNVPAQAQDHPDGKHKANDPKAAQAGQSAARGAADVGSGKQDQSSAKNKS